MSVKSDIKQAFRQWYGSLPRMRQYGGCPPKGSIAAALVVLERLRDSCDLDITRHTAPGGAQIAGLNLTALRRILKRFGETRKFPSEAGRTNRGNIACMKSLLEGLRNAGLARLAPDVRREMIECMQKFLVGTLESYHRLEKLRFDYDCNTPPEQVVRIILRTAQARTQSGPVAQHLVGAKLAIRFPKHNIDALPYSAADDQAGRAGDFQLRETSFHVTVAPSLGHVRRCRQNIDDGLRAYMLVPEDKVFAAKTLLETQGIEQRVTVQSIESFVGQNVSELAEFGAEQFALRLADLLREYNKRIAGAETDHSLMIEVPSVLRDQER